MNRGLATADVVQRRGCRDTVRQKMDWESVFSIPALHPICLNLADGIKGDQICPSGQRNRDLLFFQAALVHGWGLGLSLIAELSKRPPVSRRACPARRAYRHW